MDGKSQGPAEMVAIVGMGCRWPGGVTNPSELWQMLLNKESGYTSFEEVDKINQKGLYHPNIHRPGSAPTKGAYLLREDPKKFDHGFFGVSPPEAMAMDPQQRRVLEVVYEAFENAGEPWEKFYGSNTGVFVGNFCFDHSLMQSRDLDDASPYSATGTSVSIISNRISYLLNLQGPTMTIDTACASSLYAMHWAVKAIQNGDCDSAIVAGTNLILGPDTHLLLAKLGALSPTSTCHTFDAAADGYARAEGFGALYLKKVIDAVDGQYPIRAVIRGTAVNSNGKSQGLTQPSSDAQEKVIRHAYRMAGFSTEMTGFFETHGTGTPTGDPIEVAAIGRVFARDNQEIPLPIGSIKTNIGHTEAASGIAGVMKCILALEAGVIPPSIGIKKLNPKIDFDGARVHVVTDAIPWPTAKLRRASVNSFGFGGANAHCVLDHPSTLGLSIIPEHRTCGSATPDSGSDYLSARGPKRNYSTQNIYRKLGLGSSGFSDDETYSSGVESPLYNDKASVSTKEGGTMVETVQSQVFPEQRRLALLPFSGHTESSLRANIAAISSIVQQYSLPDLAYTLSARRSQLLHRSFVVANKDDPKTALEPTPRTYTVSADFKAPSLGFVFTGQGAQWAGMGAQLFEYAVFRQQIDDLDIVLQSLSFAPTWRLRDILAADGKHDIDKPEISQTACTALQVGLGALLQSWKVEPVATIGHSSGEIAAVYAAGLITAPEAIVAAFCRGLAVSKNDRQGAMLAVGVGEEDIQPYLPVYNGRVTIAAINSPKSITLAGEVKEVTALSDILKNEGVFCRLLRTGGNAYHSHHMTFLGAGYEDLLTQGLSEVKSTVATASRQASRQWFSSVKPGDTSCRGSINPSYWRMNLESPVRFSQAIQHILTSGSVYVDLLVEIGPHPALRGPVKQTWSTVRSTTDDFYFATLQRSQDDAKCLLETCGELFSRNFPLNLQDINAMDSGANACHKYVHGQFCIDLPTYAWSYGPALYNENRFNRELRNRKELRHDILGSRQPGSAKLFPSWRNILRNKDLPWLSHHKLIPSTVLPASAYLCMAGEALTQLFSRASLVETLSGYTLQNVSIFSALEITDKSGIEVITTLEVPEAFGPKSPRAAIRFRISSIPQGSNRFTEHCSGTIIAIIGEPAAATEKIEPSINPRYVDSKLWYRRFAQLGLGYGQAFQGLSEMQTDPYEHIASAKLNLRTTEGMLEHGESPYLIHPASLDACHQLALIACYGGMTENAKKAFVPVHIEQVSFWRASGFEAASAHAISQGKFKGLRGGYANIQLSGIDGSPLMFMKGLRCISYEGADVERPEDTERLQSPYLTIEWKSDMSLLSNDSARRIFPAPISVDAVDKTLSDMEHLATLMIAEIHRNYSDLLNRHVLPIHLQKFLDWVGRRVHSLSDTAQPFKMSSEERLFSIEELAGRMNNPEVALAKRIFDNLDDILRGEKSGLEVALQDGLLAQLYSEGMHVRGSYIQLRNIVNTLAHNNPQLRILELGAGTGGATRVAMDCLQGANSYRRYDEYMFTDISSAFFVHARQEFSACRGMKFKALDIQRSPAEQGFERGYDIVIASQVLHATSDVVAATRNVQSLLKPGGKLVLLESMQTILGHGIVLGTFTDYWHSIESYRIDGPFMNLSQWNDTLKDSGFTGVDLNLDDYPQPCTFGSTLVSTANAKPEKIIEKKSNPSTENIKLATWSDENGTLLNNVSTELQRQSYNVTRCAIDHDQIPNNSRTILFLKYQNCENLQIQEGIFNSVQKVIQRSTSLLIVTSGGHTAGHKPYTALISGMLRVISAENPTCKYANLDCESQDGVDSTELCSAIVALEQKIFEADIGSPRDQEFAWKDGALSIPRLVPHAVLNAKYRNETNDVDSQLQKATLGTQSPLKLNFRTPGIISSLFFQPDESFLQPLRSDWIEIQVGAIGLNWKDLAVCSGRLDLDHFSNECSGTVINCGRHVDKLSIGDRVFALAKGKYGNRMRFPACFAQKLLAGMSFKDGATIPIAFATALHAIKNVAQLRKGENVLIQTATGGLGLAALQIARNMGAEIFATVGTSEKMKYLVGTMSIPRSRVAILSTRDAALSADSLSFFPGQTFDVVLNTGSGEILQESMRRLKSGGRLVDVGRVDVQSYGLLHMEAFQKNASFSSFDLNVMMDHQVDICERLMGEISDMLQKHDIQPLITKTFDVSELDQALLSFSKGTHIGKTVVQYENGESLIKSQISTERASFHSHATYLLVGGLGGLGKSLISWMASRGARHIAVISRSGANTASKVAFIENVAQDGVEVQMVQCDINVKEQLCERVSRLSAERAVKGVIHAAMVLADRMFASLTFEEWSRGLAAKCAGTVNLHEATLHLTLDFFIMTTSLSNHVGNISQTAYSAANNFQDAFAHYRQRQGLPACAIALGLITEISELGQMTASVNTMARINLYGTGEHEFLRLIEAAFLQDTAPANILTCLEPLRILSKENANNHPRWYLDARLSHVRRAVLNLAEENQSAHKTSGAGGQSGASAEEGDALLQESRIDEAFSIINKTIVSRIADMLFIPIGEIKEDESISGHGIDSLIAAELRNWLVSTYQCEVSFLTLLDAQTRVSDLSQMVVEARLSLIA